MLARRDEVIHDLDDASMVPWLEERGVTLVRGHGRLAGERRVTVGDDVLVARRGVIVATGSAATIPPVPGLVDARPWTNIEGTTAKEVPGRLFVLGGGVVGVELAQVWSALGSQVTLVHRGDRLIEREEPFASEQVDAALREGGVDVRLETSVASVSRNGAVRVELEGGGSVEADELVVAIGRTPRTQDVGLETVGLEPGKHVQVDDSLRVGGSDWLFAVGDVNGRALLTHMGKYQARLAADAILGRDVRLRSDGAASPRVIFTDPQVGAVGLTLAGAEEAGLEVRAVDVETGGNAGGSFIGTGCARHRADRRRRGAAGDRRRDDHRGRGRRGAPRGDDRRRRRGAARRPLACRACVPDALRALAATARVVWHVRPSQHARAILVGCGASLTRTLALSPSDLSAHLACPHLTTLSLEVVGGERPRRRRSSRRIATSSSARETSTRPRTSSSSSAPVARSFGSRPTTTRASTRRRHGG